MGFHQREGGIDVGPCVDHPGAKRVRIGQQHKRQAVAVVGGVQWRRAAILPAQLPRVAAGDGVAVGIAQKRDAVAHGVEIGGVTHVAVGLGVIEDETRAAHQVAGGGVVDRAVILEVMVKAAGGIDRARVVERHRAGDVRRKCGRVAKYGKFGGIVLFRHALAPVNRRLPLRRS
jgi:hypothetical protein